MIRNASKSMNPWKVLESTVTYHDQWLTLRSDKVLLPDGSTLWPYHTIEGPNWVSVIAITSDGEIVFTEEYRHGARKVLMQLPGGHIDENEQAEIAGARELLEETGYGGGIWHDLGMMFGAAARLTADVRVFLALGVHAKATPVPEHGEEIHVHIMPWQEFVSALRKGKLDLPDTCDLGSLMKLQLFALSSSEPAISRLVM